MDQSISTIFKASGHSALSGLLMDPEQLITHANGGAK